MVDYDIKKSETESEGWVGVGGMSKGWYSSFRSSRDVTNMRVVGLPFGFNSLLFIRTIICCHLCLC